MKDVPNAIEAGHGPLCGTRANLRIRPWLTHFNLQMNRTRTLALAWAFLAVACTETSAPPRALTPRELGNVTAFANALGYVRFFHPTEAAVQVNWDAFAVRGIRAVQGATSDDSLAAALTSVFAPITSNVRFAKTGAPLPTSIPKPADATHVVFWRHLGAGGANGGGPPWLNLYHSERVVAPLSEIGRPVAPPPDSTGVFVSLPPVPDPSHPMITPLGGGVSMSVPIALYVHADFVAESQRWPSPPSVLERFKPTDRATRLGDVALAWSLFQHFYPYFDVVHTDWPAALDTALHSAATDADGDAFRRTLQRLTAALHDGHGYVNRESVPFQRHDVLFTRVEGRVLVSATGDTAAASGLKVGDEVVAVDGVPIQAKVDELSTMAAGATPQFVRWLALSRLLDGDPRVRATLRVSGADGAIRTVSLSRTASEGVKAAIDSIAEVSPGVMYLNLDRITDTSFDAAMPRLLKAKAVIFDMRGYPRHLNVTRMLAHLTDTVMHSANFMIPVITLPNYQKVGFMGSAWTITPAPPRVMARIIFLSGGGAVSAAESVLGVVESNRLGDIVGEPSAGTNGNVNPFTLPGGYKVNFTGMRVLKRDGTPHHGVGVMPTVPVSPTVAGIRAGRDEVLERAVSLVTAHVAP